jgi:hypothetical protein
VTRDTAHENARWPARRWLPLAAGLLVVLGLATADFWVKHRTVIGPTATLEVDPRGGVRPLAPDRLADDRPDRLFWDDDSYYWAAYARTMIEEGRFRIRRTEIDNAPYGREVHWSSGTTWLLAALAPVAEWTGSRGVDHAIADAALVVHPLLFFALAIGTALLAARRLAWWSSVALAGGFLLSPVLSRDLSYGTVDHHGLLLIFLTGTLLCLLVGGAGCVEEHSGESERRRSRRASSPGPECGSRRRSKVRCSRRSPAGPCSARCSNGVPGRGKSPRSSSPSCGARGDASRPRRAWRSISWSTSRSTSGCGSRSITPCTRWPCSAPARSPAG